VATGLVSFLLGLIGVLGALEPDARFRLVPPVLILCFFWAGSGGLDSRARFLVVGCTLCDSVVGRESVASAFVGVGHCLPPSVLMSMSLGGRGGLCWLCCVCVLRSAVILTRFPV
jgi:hypothetical protein